MCHSNSSQLLLIRTQLRQTPGLSYKLTRGAACATPCGIQTLSNLGGGADAEHKHLVLALLWCRQVSYTNAAVLSLVCMCAACYCPCLIGLQNMGLQVRLDSAAARKKHFQLIVQHTDGEFVFGSGFVSHRQLTHVFNLWLSFFTSAHAAAAQALSVCVCVCVCY